ncbi:hypothetical protein D018_4816B, partial [Vibrio parahaemolyticus VP2007-007]
FCSEITCGAYFGSSFSSAFSGAWPSTATSCSPNSLAKRSISGCGLICGQS